MDLDSYIKKVPDFPKTGILFYDISSILLSSKATKWVVEAFMEKIIPKKIDKVTGIEARGFIFAALVADRLGVPLVLARKEGKLPRKTYHQDYQLEYGVSSLEMHVEYIEPQENIMIVDDLIATGGTIEATVFLVEEKCRAKVSDIMCIVGLPFLNYDKRLSKHKVHTLINYDKE